jgi:uncharacterized membrane protein YkoI
MILRGPMTILRLAVPALLLAGAATALAAELKNCLGEEQRRAVIASRKAVPLVRAMRTVKARLRGDVINVRLCRAEKGLVYVLTVLARDGKVTHARVDAANGGMIDEL